VSLAGRHVVVTRPAGQAAHFATALSDRPARSRCSIPVLEIRDIEDPTPLLDAAIRLDSFDLAVFVSPNAIQRALAVVLARRTWPPACAWQPSARAASGSWHATASATSYRRRCASTPKPCWSCPN
jgi:uroporphyrinogen-III synthase